VRRQDHDQIRFLGGLGGRDDSQALLLGLGPRLRRLGQAHPHVDARVAQAQRVRVTLAAVADHGHLAALDQTEVGVVVIENLYCHEGTASFRCGCISLGLRVQRMADAVMDLAPRPMATIPDCTISRMPYGSSMRSSAEALSAVPVGSMVSASGETSTSLARNSCTVSSTWLRTVASARTLTSNNSR